VFELLELNADMLRALRESSQQDFTDIVNQQRQSRSLLHAALDLAAKGITSLEEVSRVVGETVSIEQPKDQEFRAQC